jgi:AraC family transcriptional regulator
MNTLRLTSGHYFGRAIARRSACGLLMVETTYRPDDTLPWHQHDRPYLLVTLDGTLIENAMHRDNECIRGTLVFNNAREPHRDRVGHAGARCLNIELGSQWLDEARERRPRERAAYVFAGPAIAAVGRLEAEFRRAGGACPLEVEHAVHALLDAAACLRAHGQRGQRGQHGRGEPSWLRRVDEHLHDRFAECFSIREIANTIAIHPAHLCRTFALHRGCTIGDYVRRLRADRALTLILHTDKPLVSVALECGFVDQPHLTRAVREFYHATPARLRRQCSQV